ncbi:hypothetical protein DL240_17925 [Lujinxingia litoralis]|uniref:Uncharacterized protein n=1 Tax=Lujinxingia litoralis TaxID=2211119 RepID=A0A328C0Z7_9DELT|nr:hypothetical protein [Lujinxingia litoralis]RAL20258.1 hypothetical protein DL240_17925 [Lujinxingia litoralis]
MRSSTEHLVGQLRQALPSTFELQALDDVIAVDYVHARGRLAAVVASDLKLELTLSVEFPEHPGLAGEALREAGRAALREELDRYGERGYRQVDSEQLPSRSMRPGTEEVPVYVTSVERGVASVDALVEELEWLAQERSQRQ